MLGTRKDDPDRQPTPSAWRPSVALCSQPDLPVHRFELLHGPGFARLARRVRDDIRAASPPTDVRVHVLPIPDPWDFEMAYEALHSFARGYAFDPDREDYLIHVNVGTHAVRICMFLLTESRHFPGRLIQSIPPARSGDRPWGGHRIIDLDLSRYARIVERFTEERRDAVDFLKYGIATRNAAFNALIEQIERVALATREPMLLTGPTGAGKSRLARRIYKLKRERGLIAGPLVEVNCATLRGDAAMSALFGHVRGAFTGAVRARPGLLRSADQGMLFLDEVTELGLDEQAMLLRAIEDHRFLPVGADEEVSSDFQLIAGTNRDLGRAVRSGRLREDLLNRIDLWTFPLPGLRDRPQDIEPNVQYELDRLPLVVGRAVHFTRTAYRRFLAFANGPDAAWSGGFRDLNGAIKRMGTFARGGRIDEAIVADEIARLRARWADEAEPEVSSWEPALVEHALSAEDLRELDRFDRAQLEEVLQVCRQVGSLSEAGRILFAASRRRKRSHNDAHRLSRYLARFGIDWRRVVGGSP